MIPRRLSTEAQLRAAPAAAAAAAQSRILPAAEMLLFFFFFFLASSSTSLLVHVLLQGRPFVGTSNSRRWSWRIAPGIAAHFPKFSRGPVARNSTRVGHAESARRVGRRGAARRISPGRVFVLPVTQRIFRLRRRRRSHTLSPSLANSEMLPVRDGILGA